MLHQQEEKKDGPPHPELPRILHIWYYNGGIFPCLPRCKNVVGVRDWETCLIGNSSTPTSWFWQSSMLRICARYSKADHVNRFSKNLSVVQAALMLGSSIFGTTSWIHLISLHWSAAKLWSLLSLRSQPNGPTAFLLEQASKSQPAAKFHFPNSSALPLTAPPRTEPPRRCGLYSGLQQPSLREPGRRQRHPQRQACRPDKPRVGDGPAAVRLPRLWGKPHLTPPQTCPPSL